MEAFNPILIPSSSGEPYYYNTAASDNTNGADAGATAGDPFNFPTGYRFCPLDEELILDYLNKKVLNEELPPNRIEDVNLYNFSPEELSSSYEKVGEKEWYFFTPRDRKYPNGNRPNRAAGSGYWKATGADKPIKDKDLTIIGFKKALVFYEGKLREGEKTNWIMHEFRANIPQLPKSNTEDMRLDDWVLCRIYKKVDKSGKNATQNEHLHSTQDESTMPQPLSSHLDSTQDESPMPQPLPSQLQPPHHYCGSSSVLPTMTTVIHNEGQHIMPYFQSEMHCNPMLTMAPITAYHEEYIYSPIDWTNYLIFDTDPNVNMDEYFTPLK